MKKIYSILLVLIVSSCATSYEPRYREPFDTATISIPKNIDKTFYLIGDAGYAKEGQSTDALIALETYLESHKEKGNYAIFLGDNIYPAGMPEEGHTDRAISEHRLNVQIDAVKNFDGQTFFIPGNHDWYNQGLAGLEREEKYFEKRLDDKKIFKPSKGCALEIMEISDSIQLMILDSQWFLEDWDKHPTINDNCPQMKSREALFMEIEGVFKKNQHKTILFALHHPLYTNGVHGGKFAPVKHIYPVQKKIPLPGLASLASLIRTSGGVSSQDNMNKQYKLLVNRLETMAKRAERVIFVSGHEHSLQYIEHEGIKQIVSGSGAKNSYATLRNDGFFAYGGQGFVRLDLLKDGASVVTYFGSKEGKPQPLFQKTVYNAPKPFDYSSLKEITDTTTVMASIYKDEGTKRTDFYESVWGDHYRELYGTKIKAKVVKLDTLYGGLEVVRRGGGHQTKSLRLRDSLGKEYNMRALKKDGVQFLQTVLFKENYVEESLENTISEDILKDFYTAAHPYAFLAIPDLADAVEVYHTNPAIFYVPKQQMLGEENNEYGNELYMIEERPEEHHKALVSFGTPDDIESTANLFERLRRDEKYKVDEIAYVRARLFDMLIGDWDRHEDQWRWAEFEQEDGTHLFKPIPRDRDQAFSNFDGAFLGGLRGLTGFANQFQVYDEKLEDVKWMNMSAIQLDRRLLNNTAGATWNAQATFIKENLTDSVIATAFKKLSREVKDESWKTLQEKLKGRRDNLVQIAERYFKYLTKLTVITGTDKDDYFLIERQPKGTTKVTISRIKDGEPDTIVSERVYQQEDTKELWIYGLDDDDVFKVVGKPQDPIRIRIIGGQNNDVYEISSGRKVSVYDFKSKPNTIKKKSGARFRFKDDYDINHYSKKQKIFGSNVLFPALGFNPDDGISLGITNTYTYNGFYRNPFSQQHQLRLGYYFATKSFNVGYKGEFAGLFGDYNLLVEGAFTNPNFSVMFFGFGNESVNLDDELGFDFNRVRMSRLELGLGVEKSGRFGSYFSYKIQLDGIQVEKSEDRFIAQTSEIPDNSAIFNRLWFAGLDATYRYESYDVAANPTRGMRFVLNGGSTTNLENTDRTFGYVISELGFYNALTRNRKWVLKTAAQSQFNIGRKYEFYQAATIGGASQFQNNGLLRGYRAQRFSGQTSLAGSADLRYSFEQFKTRILPLQIGIFAGGDLGRVWLAGSPDSNRWHSDIGGGFWMNSTDAVTATFNLFAGDDGARFSFAFLFKL